MHRPKHNKPTRRNRLIRTGKKRQSPPPLPLVPRGGCAPGAPANEKISWAPRGGHFLYVYETTPGRLRVSIRKITFVRSRAAFLPFALFYFFRMDLLFYFLDIRYRNDYYFSIFFVVSFGFGVWLECGVFESIGDLRNSFVIWKCLCL